MTDWWVSVWQWAVENLVWTHLIVFLGGALGGGWVWKYLDHRRGHDDLLLRRRMESFKAFAQASTRAHGFREGSPGETVGMGEQIAAMYLLADLANEYGWLAQPAASQLDNQIDVLKRSALPAKAAFEVVQADDYPGTPEQGQAEIQAALVRDALVGAARDARSKINANVRTPEGSGFHKVYRGKHGPYYL